MLEMVNVEKKYKKAAGSPILRQINLQWRPKEFIALIGESGSGKSTLARCLIGAQASDAGAVLFEGINLQKMTQHSRQHFRRSVAMIMQNPYSSLNPKMTLQEAVSEPAIIHKATSSKAILNNMVDNALDYVGLKSALKTEQIINLSGGQKQRAAIARAIIIPPQLIICDEITSALDSISTNKILQLLISLKETHNCGCLFITHNIWQAQALCDKILLLEEGLLQPYQKI